MNLTRIIALTYPHDTWRPLLKPKRIASAEKIQSERRKRNQAIDLVECLSLSDKRDILLDNEAVRGLLGYPIPTDFDRALSRLEELRNNLAHGNDILYAQWPHLADLAVTAEFLLQRSESFESPWSTTA